MKKIEFFDPKLEQIDRSEAIESWIKMTEADADSATHEENFWAFEYFDLMTDRHPEHSVELIKETMRTKPTPHIIGNLAAGPLEDLLARNGSKVIEEIEQNAGQDTLFAAMLSGVWQNSMSDGIWNRVQAASDSLAFERLCRGEDIQSR